MEKDAVANELVMLEEQLSTSKAQITALSETLDKQKDKVGKMICDSFFVPCAELCILFVKYAVVLLPWNAGYFHKARL